MNRPWGLSGPQFRWIYGAAMAAFFAAPWLLALFARTSGTACAQRAAEVVIGELTASGALRVDSAGQISEAGPADLAAWSATCPHWVAAQAIPDSISARKVRRRLAKGSR